jgi:CBS domain-containing protein
MSIENETVRTLIDRPTVDVDPDASLRQVAETLAEDYIGVGVVRSAPPSRGPGTHAEGLISERDIVRALAEGADPDEEIAQDVMTLDLVSLPPGATLSVVAKCMIDNEIRHVPVIDDGVVVGVVSERDILRALLDERHASEPRASAPCGSS